MAKAFVNPELLIAISVVALFLGVISPIVGAIRAGDISVFWGSILIAILPLLWLVLRIGFWLSDRRLARRRHEHSEE